MNQFEKNLNKVYMECKDTLKKVRGCNQESKRIYGKQVMTTAMTTRDLIIHIKSLNEWYNKFQSIYDDAFTLWESTITTTD